MRSYPKTFITNDGDRPGDLPATHKFSTLLDVETKSGRAGLLALLCPLAHAHVDLVLQGLTRAVSAWPAS